MRKPLFLFGHSMKALMAVGLGTLNRRPGAKF